MTAKRPYKRRFPMNRSRAKKNPCGCAAKNPSDEGVIIEPVQVTPGEPAEPGTCINWVRLEIVPSEYEACMEPLRKLGKIETAKDVFEALRGWYAKKDQEIGVVLLLDVQLNVRGVAEVSRGDRSSTIVPIPDILRVALVDGADGIVFVHNHPTGHTTPSDDDKTSTVALDEACEAVGLFLMDHCIVGRDTYFSFADAGLLSSDLVMPPDLPADPVDPQPWTEPERDAVDNPRKLTPLSVARADVAAGRFSTLRAQREDGYWYVGHLVERPLHRDRPDGPQALVFETLAGPFASGGHAQTIVERARNRAEAERENPTHEVEDRASGARRGWEHRRERDEWVVQNLDPALVPLWTRIKDSFRGSPEERYEAFMGYVHDHPGEETEALQSGADAWLDQEIAAGRARENPRGPRAMRYTSDQVTAMLANAVMWREQLTAAARERGYTGSSVAPFAEVIAFLRGASENPRHFVSAPSVGDRVGVRWTWGGSEYQSTGVVTRVNPKSVKVELLQDAGDHFHPGFVVTTTPDRIH